MKNHFSIGSIFEVYSKEIIKYSFIILFIFGIVNLGIFFPNIVPDFMVKSEFYIWLASNTKKFYLEVFSFVYSHPWTSAILILYVPFLVSFGAILLKLNRAVRKIPENAHINAKALELTRDVGLVQRWPSAEILNTDQGINGSPWEHIVQEISKSKTSSVRILGANGENTFAAINAPLNACIKNYKNNLRVILLDPDCKETAMRANSVGITPNEYKKTIRRSKTFLHELYNKGIPIKGRYYDGRPVQ